MQTVIIISRCLDDRPGKANFHFRGYYAGAEINALRLQTAKDGVWRRGEEYVMYVRVREVVKGTLVGEVLRSRPLKELMD